MGLYIAQQFIASSPDQEVIGQIALGNTQNIRRDEIEPLLKKYGLQNIDPKHWYSHQKILDMYREIASGQTNVSENLVAIGMAGAKITPLPPEANTLVAVIEFHTQFYQYIIRPVVEGEGVFVKRIDEQHYQIRLNSPYPNDLLYGYFWGLTNRFIPPSTVFSVHWTDNLNHATEPGVIIDVKWGPANSRN